MFWQSSAVIPAHTPGTDGASRAPHLRVSLVAHSASDFAGAAHTEAKYANSAVEEVDVTEAITVEILGRRMVTTAMVLGEHVLLGVTVLEELDFAVDSARQRFIPNQGTWDQPVFRV